MLYFCPIGQKRLNVGNNAKWTPSSKFLKIFNKFLGEKEQTFFLKAVSKNNMEHIFKYNILSNLHILQWNFCDPNLSGFFQMSKSLGVPKSSSSTPPSPICKNLIIEIPEQPSNKTLGLFHFLLQVTPWKNCLEQNEQNFSHPVLLTQSHSIQLNASRSSVHGH